MADTTAKSSKTSAEQKSADRPIVADSVAAVADISADTTIEQQLNAELSESSEENLLPAAKK